MKTHWRQKLSNQQISTIFYLYGQGYSKAIIARTVKQTCDVALSTTYYHLDQVEQAERMAKREQIRLLIQQGYTTGLIAKEWNMPLEEVNKLYAGKRIT
jgi:hypothetical protein